MKIEDLIVPHYFRCPFVSGPPSCHVVPGDYQAPYPSCCPRVECPSENTVNDDQILLAPKPGHFVSYDATLNDEVLHIFLIGKRILSIYVGPDKRTRANGRFFAQMK